jgi:cyclic pyranopterin phosphate synthase
MKGINDHEIFDFIKFSSENDIEVRFLEVMQIGAAYQFQNDLFISADTAISKIKEQEHLEKEIIEHDSTSFNFRTQSGAKIGFIAPESKPFCGSCSRWRLSADGFLRACLMSNKGVKISNTDPSQYDNLLKLMLDMKPINKIQHVAEYMNQIGG